MVADFITEVFVWLAENRSLRMLPSLLVLIQRASLALFMMLSHTFKCFLTPQLEIILSSSEAVLLPPLESLIGVFVYVCIYKVLVSMII